MKPMKEGKVREIYDNGDNLIMVATDRISCFDVILKNNLVQHDRGHSSEPYDLYRCKRHAGVLPAAAV